MKKNVVYILSKDVYLLSFLKKIENENWCLLKVDDLKSLKEINDSHLVVVDADYFKNNDLKQYKVIFSTHKLVVASLRPNDTEAKQMLMLGTKAYVQAYSPATVWRQILAHVQQGHVWIGESLLSRLLSQMTKTLPEQPQWQADLTDREIDVAQRVALGHPNRLIAEDLSISERTVRAHLGSVFTKLDVTDRLMLALKIHGLS